MTESHPKQEAVCKSCLLRQGKSVVLNGRHRECQLYSRAGPVLRRSLPAQIGDTFPVAITRYPETQASVSVSGWTFDSVYVEI